MGIGRRLRSDGIEPEAHTEAEQAALLANRHYYEAFEARDIDAMSDAWEHSDRVACTHPGWRTLHGWAAVSASWVALFGGPQHLQFVLTDERVAVEGDTAWVTVDENLIDVAGTSGTVAATNVYVFDGQAWKMVVHIGCPIAS